MPAILFPTRYRRVPVLVLPVNGVRQNGGVENSGKSEVDQYYRCTRSKFMQRRGIFWRMEDTEIIGGTAVNSR